MWGKEQKQTSSRTAERALQSEREHASVDVADTGEVEYYIGKLRRLLHHAYVGRKNIRFVSPSRSAQKSKKSCFKTHNKVNLFVVNLKLRQATLLEGQKNSFCKSLNREEFSGSPGENLIVVTHWLCRISWDYYHTHTAARDPKTHPLLPVTCTHHASMFGNLTELYLRIGKSKPSTMVVRWNFRWTKNENKSSWTAVAHCKVHQKNWWSSRWIFIIKDEGTSIRPYLLI